MDDPMVNTAEGKLLMHPLVGLNEIRIIPVAGAWSPLAIGGGELIRQNCGDQHTASSATPPDLYYAHAFPLAASAVSSEVRRTSLHSFLSTRKRQGKYFPPCPRLPHCYAIDPAVLEGTGQ